MAGATTLSNGSDNALIDAFLDPIFGCTPFTAPDLGNNNQPGTSQALDELSAAKNSPAVVALVPENIDEMGLRTPPASTELAKTNLSHSQVGQPPVSTASNKSQRPGQASDKDMVDIRTAFLQANQELLAAGQSPVPGTDDDLFTFLANRLSMSFSNLGCPERQADRPGHGTDPSS